MTRTALLPRTRLGAPHGPIQRRGLALAAALEEPFYEVAEILAELRESRLIDEVGQGGYGVNDLVALHASYIDDRPAPAKEAETARLIAFHHQRSWDADVVLALGRPWRVKLFPELG